MTNFAEGLEFPEGPVLLPDGGWLFVEMSPDTGCVTQFNQDGSERRVVVKTGRPNGLARDKGGNIWVAETAQRALLKLNLNDGSYDVFAAEFGGEPFLFLNDVAVGPSGDIFLTDSGIAMDEISPDGELNPDYRNLKYDGRILRIDPGTGEVECIDRGFLFTNGLAFSPAGDLYINETLTGNIYHYSCRDGQVVGKRELFGNVIEHFNPEELKGPDGMKFGADGNLYVCVFGQGDVTVLDKNGEVLNRIKTSGTMPTNLCFGKDGEQTIYITEAENGVVQKIKVECDGFPLY